MFQFLIYQSIALTKKNQRTPQQQNNTDCGVYALMQLRTLFKLHLGPSPIPARKFTPESVGAIRQFIALDLSCSQLDVCDSQLEEEAESSTPLPDTGSDSGAPQAPLPESRMIRNTGPLKNFWIQIDSLPVPASKFKLVPAKGKSKKLVPPPSPTSPSPSPPPPSQPISPENPAQSPSPPHTPPAQIMQSALPAISEHPDTDIMDLHISPSKSPVIIRKLQTQPPMIDISAIMRNPQRHLAIIPSKLPGPKSSRYQGTPWNNNSCWMDSSEWEPLYAVHLWDHAFWEWTLPLDHPTSDRVNDLRRCFAARDIVHSYASAQDTPTLLKQIRDSYHHRLQRPEDDPPFPKIGNMESCFVSKSAIISVGSDLMSSTNTQSSIRRSMKSGTETPRSMKYFNAVHLTKVFCPGDVASSTKPARIGLSFSHDLSMQPTGIYAHSGSIQSWLNSVYDPCGVVKAETGHCVYKPHKGECDFTPMHLSKEWILRLPVLWLMDLASPETVSVYMHSSLLNLSLMIRCISSLTRSGPHQRGLKSQAQQPTMSWSLLPSTMKDQLPLPRPSLTQKGVTSLLGCATLEDPQ